MVKKKSNWSLRKVVVVVVLAVLIFIPLGSPIRDQRVDCEPSPIPQAKCSVVITTRTYGYPFGMEFYTETDAPQKEMDDAKWVRPFVLNFVFYLAVSWFLVKLFEKRR
ncbi:MAG: hypothetical protein M3P98_00575 [bacterium]|nr:hypothetical protein [bacterium]